MFQVTVLNMKPSIMVYFIIGLTLLLSNLNTFNSVMHICIDD
jgi:hypothetical protein